MKLQVVSLVSSLSLKRGASGLVWAGLLGVCALGAWADTHTWTPTSGTNWNVAENWRPQAVPVNGDSVTIDTVAYQVHALNNDCEGLTLGTLFFSNGGNNNQEGTVTLSGKALSISGSGNTGSGALYIQYPRTHIQTPLTFTAAAPFLMAWSRGRIFFEAPVTTEHQLIGYGKAGTTDLAGLASAQMIFCDSFYAAEGFVLRAGNFVCGKADVFDPRQVITFAAQAGDNAYLTFNLEGFDQTIDRLTYTPGNVLSASQSLVRNTTSNPSTLTMKARANGGTDALFSGALSLVWDPQGDFSFTTYGGRASTMTGSITVKGGTFDVANGATFAKVASVTLANNARLVVPAAWPFAKGGAFTLASSADARIVRPAGTPVEFWSGFSVDGTLTLADGEGVVMSLTTRVPVSKRFVFDNLVFSFTEGALQTTGVKDLFVLGAEADAATCEAWRRSSIVGEQRLAGRTYTFLPTIENGQTRFSLVIAEQRDVSDVATYDGTQEGLWSATTRATFAGAEPKSVTIADSVETGSIDFTADGYALGGSGTVTFDAGAKAQVKVIGSGVGATVLDGLSFSVPLFLETFVDKGSTLAFGQTIAAEGIHKTGEGTLRLTNGANAFDIGVQVSAGQLVAEPVAAIGAKAGGVNVVTLSGGTLTLKDSQAEATLPVKVSVDAGAADVLTVVKADSDVVIEDFDSKSGALVKRGGGKLTVRARAGEEIVLASGNGNFGKSGIMSFPYWNDGWSFADDGAVTHANSALYVGLNVFEGPFALVGEGADSVFRMNGSVHAGSGLNSGTPAQVSFLLSNVTLDLSPYTFWLGSGIQGSNSRAKSASLVLTDATLRTGQFEETRQCGRPAGNTYVCSVALTNATLEVSDTYHAAYCNNGSTSGDVKTYLAASNSFVLAKSFLAAGAGSNSTWKYTDDEKTFDASWFGYKADGSVGQDFSVGYAVNARYTFRNGSVWHLKSLRACGMSKGVYTFDDGELRADSDNFDLIFGTPENGTRFVLVGRGLTLNANAGETRTFYVPVTGEGDFVKTGAGTVVFETGKCVTYSDAQIVVPTPSGTTTSGSQWKNRSEVTCADATTARFSGTSHVLGGTLRFAAGSIAAGAGRAFDVAVGANVDFSGAALSGTHLSGGGRVANAAFVDAVIVAPTDENCLTLDGVTLSGCVSVDFGRADGDPLPSPYPTDLTVMKYVGAAPDISTWKAIGTGRRSIKGRFSAADGKVMVTLSRNGYVLIFR